MAYIGTSPSNGVRRRFVYEATASQTSFSGSDENGVTLTYVDSLYLDVYQNGIKLKAGDDYTATTGTSVVLVQGASVNDVVEMVAFDVFSVGDTVSAKDGGSFAGTVGFGAGIAGGVVFNEAGADVDFRVESNDSANMFVVNAGTNKIGIGTNSPSHPLHVQSSSDGTGVGSDDLFVAFFNNAEATDDRSFGVKISAGSTNIDSSLTITDHDQSNTLYNFKGQGQADFQTNTASYMLKLTQNNTSADGVWVRQIAGTPNSGSRFYFAGQDETNSKAVIYTNGDFYSRTGTYGTFSDESIKQDIKDANSQWEDIKAVRIRNFRLKDEVADDADYPYYIGVIAQEIEASGMNGLVSENLYKLIENEDGTKTETTKKGVKYSILYVKAIKALQEAMTRIETLESANTSLEARITALENA